MNSIPQQKRAKITIVPNKDLEMAGHWDCWWMHTETQMKSVSRTVGFCEMGFNSSHTNEFFFFWKVKFLSKSWLTTFGNQNKMRQELCKVKTLHQKAAGFPCGLKTLVAWCQWPAPSPGNHRQVQISCFWRSRCWGRCKPRGQALKSRSRSGTEMRGLVLRDIAQKHEGRFYILWHLSISASSPLKCESYGLLPPIVKTKKDVWR